MNRLALLLLGLLGAAWGCSDKCSDKRDCPAGLDCNEEGVCVTIKQPGVNPPPPPPPTPDMGPQVTDMGMVVDMDMGTPLDAGPQPDAGPTPDLGPRPDMGVMGMTLPNEGLVWLGEYQTLEGPAFTAFGSFEDRSAASYAVNSASYTGGAGEVCELRVETLVGGTLGWFDASNINVTAGPSPHAMINFVRVAPGRFAPSGTLTGALFTAAQRSSFSIVSNQMSGLDSYTAMVDAPITLLVSQPVAGAVVLLNESVTVTWQMNTVGPMSAQLVFELRDVSHSTSVRCVLNPGVGTFTLPLAAVAGFRAANPSPPFYVELSNSSEQVMNVPVLGGGSLPVTFRASQGVRWLAE